MDGFTKRPMVVLKIIRYPPPAKPLPRRFGVRALTDFGGVTFLLQGPDRYGLEVWLEGMQARVPVQAVQNVYIINCGDMIMMWLGGQYKSAKYRVIDKTDNESRLSCARFFRGDAFATNPLNPQDRNKDTVGQLQSRWTQVHYMRAVY